MKVKLARRTDVLGQGQNIDVSIKNEIVGFKANDRICTQIAALTGSGLVEYDCDNVQGVAQVVLFSSTETVLTICEAEVWLEEVPGKSLVINHYVQHQYYYIYHQYALSIAHLF